MVACGTIHLDSRFHIYATAKFILDVYYISPYTSHLGGHLVLIPDLFCIQAPNARHYTIIAAH